MLKAALFVSSVLVLGCSGGTVSTSTATPAPTIPTASPAPTPSPTLARCEAAGARPLAIGILTPGTYVTCKFVPQLTFTVAGERWGSFHDEAAVVAVDRFAAIPAPPGPAELLLSATRAANVRTPEDLHRQVASVTGLSATPPEPTTVGGAAGIRFEVTGASTTMWPIATGGGQIMRLNEGRRARVRAVQVGGEVVIVSYQIAQDRFAAVSPDAESVIASIRFVGR